MQEVPASQVLQRLAELDRKACRLPRSVDRHPYLAGQPFGKKEKWPPDVPAARVPYDSTIARPGIRNPDGNTQLHWEFVARRENVYLELFIHFRCA